MAGITGGSDDEFWVTLPSNSNAKQFKNNTPSSFKVRLRNPIDLSASDSGWEVALLSTQYTHNWYNFREDCCIRFMVKIPNLRANTVTPAAGASGSPSSQADSVANDQTEATSSADLFYREGEYGWHFDDFTGVDHYLRHYQADNTIGIDDSWVYYKTTLRRGYFANVRELGKEISRQFARAFSRHDVHLHFHLDYETGLASFTTTRAKVAVFIENPYLATILGMPMEKVVDGEYPEGVKLKAYLLKVIGTTKPRLDVVNSLYVYSDIGKYQAVGDVEAPLLGIVPVQGAPGARLYWSFNPLCYLPVNKTYIQEIEMRLCTDEGDAVPFAAGSDNVVCCLRFRKTRHSSVL